MGSGDGMSPEPVERVLAAYTDRRKLTLVESVADQAVPAGGENGTMSYYANYVLFDAAWPLGEGSASGRRQVFLRYLGGM
jgi:hypothetical protein